MQLSDAGSALRRVGLLLLAAGLLLAGGVIGYVVGRSAAHQTPLTPEKSADLEPLIAVLRTTRELDAGERITRDDLRIIHMPQSMVPPDLLDDLPRAGDLDDIIGVELNQELGAGRILQFSHLEPPSEEGDMP